MIRQISAFRIVAMCNEVTQHGKGYTPAFNKFNFIIESNSFTDVCKYYGYRFNVGHKTFRIESIIKSELIMDDVVLALGEGEKQ